MVDSGLHGGNLEASARRLGCRPDQILDASASIAPFALPRVVRRSLRHVDLRAYPDRSHCLLRQRIAQLHSLDPDAVLPGNGAAELFTWAARDAASSGVSLLPQPGFADYGRSLQCWGGQQRFWPLPLEWTESFPQPFPAAAKAEVLWITNPHNPTGQLWSRESLEQLLTHHRLVICDEAFLPLVPGGERESLIPLVAEHSNLVVIRSLTKLYGIAGVRLGYAVAQPERLQRWSQWRDPWPVNSIALAVGERLLSSPLRYLRWCERVQRWVAVEGAWMQQQLSALTGITPMPSAANYLLISANQSLVLFWEAVEQRHRILLRNCLSFRGLGETWLRIGLQSRRNNRRIVWAMREELKRSPLA